MSGNATAIVRAAAPDTLSRAIQYSLAETASYIKERRGSLFTPLGGNIYNPQQGTRLIRFTISDSNCFLDPSSVVLSFRLRNVADNGNLRLRGPPQILFERARLLVRGTLIEDITEVPYLVNFLRLTDTSERQTNDAILNYWNEGTDELHVQNGIPPQAGRRVMCDLRMFGLFRNNDKHIPLPWCALTIELTLTDGTNAFASNSPALVEIAPAPGNVGRAAQAAIPRSQVYALEDVGLRCDLLLMAPELVARYSDLLDQGSNLPMAFTSMATTRHQVFASAEQDFQTTRSLALCKSVFFSFSFATQVPCETVLGNDAANRLVSQAPWKMMVNPRWLVADEQTDEHDQFQWQVHLGGHVWPVNPVRGTGAESWYQLRATLDLSNYGYNSFEADGWKTIRWLGAIDLERGAGSLDNLSFTGQPLKSGEPVTIRVKGLDPADGHHPTLCFITLAFDAIMTISRAGVDINY